MSLLDAILLEPHRDAKNVWIALRSDGNNGSGTEDDPYHGGVKFEAPINVTHLEQDTIATTAVATTDGNHDYSDGDLVGIGGATGSGSEFYNGTFVIRSASGNTFKYDMTDDPGGAASGSSIQARRMVLQLDVVLQSFELQEVNDLIVRLGPGEFLTRGNGGQANPLNPPVGWRIRKGWKMIGSGMDTTKLKLVGAQKLNVGLYYAIGTYYYAYADHSEVSDLTVNCNLRGTENGIGVATAAVGLLGNHLRIRRVRAIEFGTWQPRPQDGVNSPESFVLAVGGLADGLTEPTDCRIECCIVEKRAEVPGADNITCLAVTAGEVPPDGIMIHPRGCVIRDCLADGRLSNGNVNLQQVVWGCSVSGVGSFVERNRFYNLRAGGPYHDSWPQLDVVVRNNHYRNVVIGTWEHMGGISRTNVGIRLKTLEYELDGSEHVAHVTTFKEHGFQNNDLVRIYNIGTQNVLDDDNKYYYYPFDVPGAPGDPGIPRFQVTRRGPNDFDYIMKAAPLDNVLVSPTENVSGHLPAYNTATFSTPFDFHRLLASLTYDSGTGLATATIADDLETYGVAFASHDFRSGDIVEIVHGETGYNGYFLVKERTDAKSFKFKMYASPPSNSSESGYYAKRWQAKELIIESNVFELAPQAISNGVPRGVYIEADGISASPQYTFPKVVIRHNTISHVDRLRIPGDNSRGIDLFSVQKAIIEGNVIDLDVGDPILTSDCLKVKCFNNTSADGTPLAALITAQSQHSEELKDKIMEATIIAF